MARTRKYYYSTNNNFNIAEADKWLTGYFTNYLEAAQEIARYLDEQNRQPIEQHYFWLLSEEHEYPMKMKVVSELVPEYHAEILEILK